MSRKINQKKEAFLASGGLLRSAGLAVPVAGVSSISNFIHQAHHLPAMQQHPGRVRGPHFCMKLRHYKILHSVPAPVSSACNLVRSPGQNAGAITLKNYAPLENGPQSRLHNFRVGAAGPINLRPVFFSKFYPGNLPRPIYFKKVKFEVIVTSGECKEARSAVTFAGVSSINTNQANHLNLPAMSLHPGRAWVTHFCVKLRHYKILHSVPAPVFSPNAPRYKLKFGVVPNVGFSRCIGSRGALFSPATFPSGVFIASEVTPSCKPTAGRASRLIRLDSDAASPMQSVSACGSAGSLSSHQTRISP